MPGEIIYILVIIGVLLFYVLVNIIGGNAAYKKAQQLEKDKKYEAACLQYAFALKGFNSKESKERINHLWKNHGPFNFLEVYDEEKKRECASYAACAHLRVVKVITKVISQE